MRRYSAYSANQVMTTTAATSMISKNSTTAASLVRRESRLAGPTRYRADVSLCIRLGNRRHMPRRRRSSGDLDVDLVDARAGRCHAGVAVARRRQRAQRPRAGRGEEPEVTGGRRDDLGGELVRASPAGARTRRRPPDRSRRRRGR